MNLYLVGYPILDSKNLGNDRFIDFAIVSENNKAFFANFTDVDYNYDNENEYIKHCFKGDYETYGDFIKSLTNDREFDISDGLDYVFIEGDTDTISKKLINWLQKEFGNDKIINKIITFEPFQEINILKNLLLYKNNNYNTIIDTHILFNRSISVAQSMADKYNLDMSETIFNNPKREQKLGTKSLEIDNEYKNSLKRAIALKELYHKLYD